MVGPLSGASLRFLLASLALVSLWVCSRNSWPRPSWRLVGKVLVLGLTGVATYNYCFFFRGLETVVAGRAAVIVATHPIFIASLSALLLDERPTWFLGPGRVPGCLALGASLVLAGGGADQPGAAPGKAAVHRSRIVRAPSHRPLPTSEARRTCRSSR